MTPNEIMRPAVVSKKKPDWFHITAGDRVVIIRGKEKGKIGEVTRSNEDSLGVTIQAMNMRDVRLPEYLLKQNQGSKVTTLPAEVPLEDTRLVYQLRNEKTGALEDTIIERLEKRELQLSRKDKASKSAMETTERVVAGTDIVIPWPDQAEPETQEYEGDTTADLVDEVTFVPHLLTAPMPILLIDELRNKHSMFRTRYDDEYVAKKEEAAATLKRREGLIETMRTPTQEIAALRIQQKRLTEKPLNEQQLARIGEVMLQEQEKAAKQRMQA